MPRGTELRRAAAEAVAGFVPTAPCEPPLRADVRIRNFDPDPHELTIQLSAIDADIDVDRTYYVPPDTTACIVNELEPGPYDVAATLDGHQHAIGTGRVDDGPGGTIVIETGNGVISIANNVG